MRFSQQRWFGWAVFLIVAGEMVALHLTYARQLPRLDFLTGWVLLGVVLLLAFFNVRKKLPFLPLLHAEKWMQVHIYAALVSAVLFALHVSYRLPAGWFNWLLALLYLLVMASGVYGLYLTRAIPKRLTTRGGEVLFERIPDVRRQFQEQAEQLAFQPVAGVQSGVLSSFYLRELKPFFAAPKHFSFHWNEDRSPVVGILGRISDERRYLNEAERRTLDQIAALVRQKDGLDYHYAQQLLLRAWLFVHIPLTYGLLVFTAAHIVLVFAFSGGAR
jgi:hypothetical protein